MASQWEMLIEVNTKQWHVGRKNNMKFTIYQVLASCSCVIWMEQNARYDKLRHESWWMYVFECWPSTKSMLWQCAGSPSSSDKVWLYLSICSSRTIIISQQFSFNLEMNKKSSFQSSSKKRQPFSTYHSTKNSVQQIIIDGHHPVTAWTETNSKVSNNK